MKGRFWRRAGHAGDNSWGRSGDRLRKHRLRGANSIEKRPCSRTARAPNAVSGPEKKKKKNIQAIGKGAGGECDDQ